MLICIKESIEIVCMVQYGLLICEAAPVEAFVQSALSALQAKSLRALRFALSG